MLQQLLIKYRGVFLFLFIVPLSFIIQHIIDFKNWIFRNLISVNHLHDRRVKKIQKLVEHAYLNGLQMCTARAPWKTMSIRKATYKKNMVKIPLNLNNILHLDEEHLLIRVEPMLTMGEITRYLVSKGYALAVQVEMEDLTVSGLCMGIGIETSSHQKGFLYETVNAYDIITAQGDLLRVTKYKHHDLFNALPMSHGTLGFLVAVELKIVPVKKYMKLRYLPCHTSEEFCELMSSLTEDEFAPNYIEGLVFSKNKAVVMTGELTDKIESDGSYNPINRWYKPWFYTHVSTFLKKGVQVEYIPLRSYFHRHTSSIFFQLKDIIPFANQWWYRWFFGWMGAPKIKLMKLSMTKKLRERAFNNRVSQDIIIPMKNLGEALTISDDKYGIYPLWICPVKLKQHDPEGLIRKPKTKTQMFVDVGIYGIPSSVTQGKWDSVKTGRYLEEFTINKGGFHMLYADIFMTKSEFEKMFSHRLYNDIRERYKANGIFPDLYDKVIPEKWLINLEEEKTEKEVALESNE